MYYIIFIRVHYNVVYIHMRANISAYKIVNIGTDLNIFRLLAPELLGII